jgi:hypothetical protein
LEQALDGGLGIFNMRRALERLARRLDGLVEHLPRGFARCEPLILQNEESAHLGHVAV